MYRILTTDSISPEAMVDCLYLKSEHNALEAVNKLEAAIFAWKEKIAEYASGKSPARTSWTFPKDPMSESDKMEALIVQAEVLLHQLKAKYPNLPHSFLDVTKIQYNKVSIRCSFGKKLNVHLREYSASIRNTPLASK